MAVVMRGVVMAVRTVIVVVVMRVVVDVPVVVAVLLAFAVAVFVHGIRRAVHAPCRGAVPSACSAWWMASITSWRACSFCSR